MNHATHIIGDATSVIYRFGSENGFVRPEKLEDVAAANDTPSLLYMQIFEINDGLVPFGASYYLRLYQLNNLTIGHTYQYVFGSGEASIINGSTTITKKVGTFVSQGSYITLNSIQGSLLTTLYITDITVPQASQQPLSGSIPRFSFPVQAGLGGTLGIPCDMTGIFCGWSTAENIYTPVAEESGSINIIVKE